MSTSSVRDIQPQQRQAFYAAAIAGLRALDARERTPRRFGVDADARWASFKGGLSDADRIDVLLRDAAVTWGPAFSPAEVFGLFGLAPDEPFGPDWQSLGHVQARRALRPDQSLPTPESLANMLGFVPGLVEVPPLGPSTRLAVAGGVALVGVAKAFQDGSGLSWSDQVLVVSNDPATRQFAGLLAIVVGSSSRTRLVRPSDDLRSTLKEAGFVQLEHAVVSRDADEASSKFARSAAGVA